MSFSKKGRPGAPSHIELPPTYQYFDFPGKSSSSSSSSFRNNGPSQSQWSSDSSPMDYSSSVTVSPSIPTVSEPVSPPAVPIYQFTQHPRWTCTSLPQSSFTSDNNNTNDNQPHDNSTKRFSNPFLASDNTNSLESSAYKSSSCPPSRHQNHNQNHNNHNLHQQHHYNHRQSRQQLHPYK